jgi:N,N'-diacetyllegionaminate synthase
MKKIELIAEIGWNHMGNIKIAEKMIKEASLSGADYAKFQTWSVKNLQNGPWDLDGRRAIYEKAELKKDDYLKLVKICKKYKIKFLTSLFNHQDYELISKLNLKTIKIPSPENRNKNLLKFCSQKFDKIFLSTGAATINEISTSYKLIKNKNVYLMHCVSMYPCPDKLVNLNRINKLKKISNKIKLGLSDHSPDILSAQLSLPFGIKIIEKHFTIDNKLPGRDNKFAILPKELKTLKNSIIRYENMSKVQNSFSSQEKEIRKVYTGRWIKH